MLAVWLLRERIAIWLFDDTARSTEVGLIGVAILLALLGTAQTAVLQGMRKITNLGRVTVLGAFVGTVAGLAAVWIQGETGLIWLIVLQPLAVLLVALHYTRRLPKSTAARLSPVEAWQTWTPLAKLGAAFMLGELATAVTLLLVRGRISQELGLEAAGNWTSTLGDYSALFRQVRCRRDFASMADCRQRFQTGKLASGFFDYSGGAQ